MYFTVDKARKYISDLRHYIFAATLPIETFRHSPRDVAGAHRRDFDDSAWAEFKTGSLWGGPDQIHWFRAMVEIPAEWRSENLALLLTPGSGQEGGLAGSETLAFIDGAPVQGLDANHHQIHLLPEWAEKGEVQVALKAYSGLRSMHQRFKTAALVKINEAAEDFYFRALACLETIQILPEGDFDRENLLLFLNGAINSIDFRKPGSEQFYQSVAGANENLRAELADYKPAKENQPKITAVGHSHIDVAWLWRLIQTREKSSRTFSTVNHLMRQYPEYQFVQSQPQLYDYIKEDYPEIYEQIKARVAAGRWEVTGGMWVEADCNIPSGESLVRQFLFGTRFMKEEFGVTCSVLWLPDVFGYSWALPQIILKSGLQYFMTTKISWSQYNRPTYDTFKWRGIDGSEVLSHFITTTESEKPMFYTYNGTLNPASAVRSWQHYQQKDINDELLLAYGWGDGGGGPTKEMIEMGKKMQEMPGIPRVEFGKAEPYFKRLAAKVAENPKLPVVDGELYLEYHRGTYTSQAQIKRANRKGEIALHDLEFLHSLALNTISGHSYPQAEINENWKILLRNQFHDILPGSSIKEVYEDAEQEFSLFFNSAKRLQGKVLQSLAEKTAPAGEKLVVFNSLSWARGGTVTLPWQEGLAGRAFYTEEGEKLAAKRTENGSIEITVPKIPALGYRAFQMRQDDGLKPPQPAAGVSIEGRLIQSKYYKIEFNELGLITSLYDKQAKREVIPKGRVANELQFFEDRPLNFDAWDIDIYYREKQYPVDELSKWEVLEKGPDRVVVALQWKFMQSTIDQKIYVYADRRTIDFVTEVDWRQSQILLKTAFPIDVRATKAAYEIQFGNVERPTHWNTSWDYAKFETVAHKWVDLSERGYGASLLNDCKYGHDIKDNVIRLTLIKSGIDPDPKADQGPHSFTYSLLPHEGDWYEAKTTQAAYELNYPLSAVFVDSEAGHLPPQGQLLEVEAASTVLETVKKAEDGSELILRFYEFGNRRDNVKVTLANEPAGVVECNLMEEDLKPHPFREKEFTFSLKPYEIRTFKIK